MRSPTLRQLRFLVAVADAERFTIAAERCGVSQPALSEQIAQLERTLGAALIERGRHGARLTPIGRATTERARRVLADVDDLVHFAGAASADLGGLIRLGVLPTLGPYLLPSVIPDLHSAYPALELYVRERRTIDLEAELRAGLFDVILSTPPDDRTGLRSLKVFEEPLRVVAPSDHRLARCAVVGLEDLADENLLLLEDGHNLSARVRAIAARARARLRVDYQGSSLDALRQMVGMGMGLSIFPLLYVASEMREDRSVSSRPIGFGEDRRAIELVWRAASPRGADFQALADVIGARGERLIAELGTA